MQRLFFLLLLVSSNLGFAQLITGEDIAVAQTESGPVRGYLSDGIYTYKGIPYAQAGRFEAPRKPEPWTTVRSSLSWGPVAPLLTPTTSVADELEFVFDHDWGYPNEDCLRLNVWTPGLNDGKKRPVMFWIHGGGFTAGSSQELPSYHGENLARRGDVVVVSINHRLNILGFLDLSAYGEKYQTSANNSIVDMRVALEWVRDNIERFGGDPDNVTIFGQSGGGAKVNTLMAMPSARGLFHRAVNQSGAFRSGILEQSTTRAIAAAVVEDLGLTPATIDEIQNVPFDTLAAAGSRALARVQEQLWAAGAPTHAFGLSWGPSVDGNVLLYQMYAPEALALSDDVPLLIGTAKNEFMPSIRLGMSGASAVEIDAYLTTQYGDRAEAYRAAVREAYPHDTRPTDLIDVDMMFRPGAVHQANLKSARPRGAPVYMYLFSWQSPILDGKYKALHCMEIPFVFDNIDRSRQMTGGGAEAHALAAQISQAWINFARTGDPNTQGLPEWEPYTEENGTTMMLDTRSVVRHHPDRALLNFINSAR
ncbi:para-nitrobenzyl esterase [Lewinella marina]|uniref:Carboxylic ester hydrolase n=1 Tax=Neolewinella marina TaxID=438751 RepID=A0A2G0CIK5_9BACT|nr:carboxylesterase family protein [Neolewinella marina]NJB85050.1 para-nitrobenzyl esterase [Neolewinella marina]PHK99805.1 carboxylesterase [Neolewinella marina]